MEESSGAGTPRAGESPQASGAGGWGQTRGLVRAQGDKLLAKTESLLLYLKSTFKVSGVLRVNGHSFFTLSSPGAGGMQGQLQGGLGLNLFWLCTVTLWYFGITFPHSFFSLFFSSVMRWGGKKHSRLCVRFLSDMEILVTCMKLLSHLRLDFQQPAVVCVCRNKVSALQ